MNLELIRGDTNKINLTLRRPRIDPATGKQQKDEQGVPLYDAVDLNGATLWLTATDASGAAVISLDSTTGGIVPTDPASGGLAVAIILPAATEGMAAPLFLDYDVQLLETDNSKTTVARGQMVVTSDVTPA